MEDCVKNPHKTKIKKIFLSILQNLEAKVWKTVSKIPIKRIFFSKMWKMWKVKMTRTVDIQGK